MTRRTYMSSLFIMTLSAVVLRKALSVTTGTSKHSSERETGFKERSNMFEHSVDFPPIPPDDKQRHLAIAKPNSDQTLPHIGLVGDTYTILLSGNDTAGRFCVIDMHVPPGGGPAPHRHDF